MDFITILSLLIMIVGSMSSHIRSKHSDASHAEVEREVRLVQNPFHIIIQNSIPTSLPVLPALPAKTSKYRLPDDKLSQYQADEAFIQLPVEDLPALERSILSKPKTCRKQCEYGFETDIEGVELCRCKDPCKGVQCFGGLKCEPQRECILDQCTYNAVCKADDACSLPKPKYTFMCDKLSKRYYFDQKKGLCRKFWGCESILGNSFENKKDCKNACYSKEEKRRDRASRQQRKESRESQQEVIDIAIIDESPSSEMVEISNMIPTFDVQPNYQRNIIAEKNEELNNRIEEEPHKQRPSMFTQNVPGLNQLTGCPEDKPYVKCPFDPCAGCTNSNIMCFTSFCGTCQAIYIDLYTGEASDKFAAIC